MSDQCRTCGQVNLSESKICSWCKAPLVQAKASKIEELITKQEQLETRHSKEIAELRNELLLLRRELANNQTSVIQESPIVELLNDKEKIKKEETSANSKIEGLVNPVIEESKPILNTTDKEHPTSLVNEVSTPIIQPIHKATIVSREISEFGSKLKKVIEPLYDGLDLVFKVYTKYKTEGKLPIFFMTIAGIIAILFGFGYLMQYSLSAAGIYQGLIKVGLGFSAALVSILIGIRLSKKENDLKEYASALISLGIILNYVMIYYMTELGNLPLLSESLLGFLLIVVNTGIAIAFALKFEAKIIAILFVIGGAFAPFYLSANEDGTFYYLYLWFLTFGACYVSIKIRWKILQYLAFSISALLLEITVFTHEPTSYLYIGYYHLFAYLFFYFTFFEKRKIKQQLDKIDLVVLASNLGFFSWNLFSASQVNLFTLGIVYIVNAFVFITLLLKYSSFAL